MKTLATDCKEAHYLITSDEGWFKKHNAIMKCLGNNNFELIFPSNYNSSDAINAINEMDGSKYSPNWISTESGCRAYWKYYDQGSNTYISYAAEKCGQPNVWSITSTSHEEYYFEGFFRPVSTVMCSSCDFYDDVQDHYFDLCEDPLCMYDYLYSSPRWPVTGSGYRPGGSTELNECLYANRSSGCSSDPCEGVNCPDHCEGDWEYSNGHCNEGDCYYGTQEYCENGCQNGRCIEPPVECYNNGDCGTNNYIGNPYCQDGDIYQNYRTYTCHNPGQTNSYCTQSDSSQLINECQSGCENGSCIDCESHDYFSCYSNDVYWFDSCNNREDKKEECGGDSCGNWSSNYCNNDDVYHSRTCYDKGCSENSCFNNQWTDEQLVQDCGELDCQNGECLAQSSSCSAKSWGPSSWTNPFIYYVNDGDIAGFLEDYDGYFKASANFKWNQTKLENLRNESEWDTAIKFEFRRFNETWDGVGEDCDDFWCWTNLPGFVSLTGLTGLEESDYKWGFCAERYDFFCWLDTRIGKRCDEEYQMVANFVVPNLVSDKTYDVKWKMFVDKDGGSEPTLWEASIETGTFSQPHVDECYLQRDESWSIPLKSGFNNGFYAFNKYLLNLPFFKLPKTNYLAEKKSSSTYKNNSIAGKELIEQKYSFQSKQELMNFKSKREIETKEILGLSNEQNYVGLVTFNQPLPKLEFLEFTTRFNLTPKAVRYVSTEGGCLAPAKYLGSMEERIDEKEIANALKSEISDFKLIDGISAIRAQIPKESVLSMQKDPLVFLVDIGPKEAYANPNKVAITEDVAYFVNEYLT